MALRIAAVFVLCVMLANAQDDATVAGRTTRFLMDLLRLDTSNPPGNETRVAE